MSAPLSVYVVEDDSGVMLAVLAALARPACGFHLAGASPTGESAPELVADEAIDIFVCDRRLPNADGLDLIARAKELRPSLRTVLMTGYPSPDLTVRALLAGADAILFKPFNADELCDSLRAALSGQRVLCAEAAQHLGDLLRLNGHDGAPPGTLPEDALTKREAEVLQLLSTGKTAKEVADRLGLTEATVAGYRKDAFKKLSVHKLQEALNKLRGGGAESGETAGRRLSGG